MQMLRSPESPPPDYEPQYSDDPGYFRVVQHGMPVLCLLMSLAGVLDESGEEPSFPDWPPPGIANAERAHALFVDGEGVDPPPTEAELEAIRWWDERANVVRRSRSQAADRVPAFKFGLQMDWIVGEEEARVIARGLRRALAENPQLFEDAVARLPAAGLSSQEALDWIRRWARFNEVAAEHGGYRIS
jgi:hypothetical protein